MPLTSLCLGIASDYRLTNNSLEKILDTIDLQQMSAEDLLALGRQIGAIGIQRPDITHQIMVGLRNGMMLGPNPHGYGFGDLLYGLWHWWYYHVADPDTTPPIPFDMQARPSGVGMTPSPWRFQRNE